MLPVCPTSKGQMTDLKMQAEASAQTPFSKNSLIVEQQQHTLGPVNPKELARGRIASAQLGISRPKPVTERILQCSRILCAGLCMQAAALLGHYLGLVTKDPNLLPRAALQTRSR